MIIIEVELRYKLTAVNMLASKFSAVMNMTTKHAHKGSIFGAQPCT